MKRKHALEAILAMGSRIFAVEFIKSDGTKRLMNCRLGVKAHLKNPPTTDLEGNETSVAYDGANDLVRVYDMVNKGYRSFHLAKLLRIKVHGEWKDVK